MPERSTSRSVARDFLPGVAIALAAAWIAPDLGKYLRHAIAPGVMAIFFLQGAGLPTEQFRRSLGQWRLHVFIQAFCFLAFPLFTWLLLHSVPWMPADLAYGFLYLAILPTTISSATVLTAAAEGDVPSAIVNTAAANIAGVFLVPFATSVILSTSDSTAIPLLPVLAKVALWILLPLLIGQLARPRIGSLVAKHKRKVSKFSNAVIFFLLYISFCGAFASHSTTSPLSGETLAWAIGGSATLLASISFIAWIATKRFAPIQRTTAFYCSSQKTLATGLSVATAVFAAGDPSLLPSFSAFILPLLCYHPLQLILGGFLTERLAAQS